MAVSDYVRNIRAKIGHDLLMMVGATGIVFNDDNAVLLQLRSDNHKWGLPGGAIDPGEEPAEAVIREIREETGLVVVPQRIIGVYGGQDHLGEYPNGDQVAIISIVFMCKVVGGELTLDDDESLELRYFRQDELPQDLLPRHLVRIEQAYKGQAEAHFRLP